MIWGLHVTNSDILIILEAVYYPALTFTCQGILIVTFTPDSQTQVVSVNDLNIIR